MSRGGKRKGAGRKKKAPSIVYQLRIDESLVIAVKSSHSIVNINNEIRELFNILEKNSNYFEKSS